MLATAQLQSGSTHVSLGSEGKQRTLTHTHTHIFNFYTLLVTQSELQRCLPNQLQEQKNYRHDNTRLDTNHTPLLDLMAQTASLHIGWPRNTLDPD